MASFLQGPDILETIRFHVKNAAEIKFAVAYWGRLAAFQLRLEGKSTKIVCDALSGNCNPKELRHLKEQSTVDLRHIDGLHSKVYWTDTGAVVGSANASLNGLGYDDGYNPRVEAAVDIREQRSIDDISTWFDGLWGRACPVDDALLLECERIWKRVQEARPWPPKTKTLLEVLKLPKSELFMRPIHILAYEEEVSEASKQQYDVDKRTLYSPRELKGFEDEGVLPLYEMPENWSGLGQWVLDFERQNGRYVYGGIKRVRDGDAPRTQASMANFYLDEVRLADGLACNKRDGNTIARWLDRTREDANTRDLSLADVAEWL